MSALLIRLVRAEHQHPGSRRVFVRQTSSPQRLPLFLTLPVHNPRFFQIDQAGLRLQYNSAATHVGCYLRRLVRHRHNQVAPRKLKLHVPWLSCFQQGHSKRTAASINDRRYIQHELSLFILEPDVIPDILQYRDDWRPLRPIVWAARKPGAVIDEGGLHCVVETGS